MQELGDNTIRRVDWQNVFPVVLLPRAYKFALGFRVLVLAFFGLALTSFFAGFFVGDTGRGSERGNVSQTGDAADTPIQFVTDTTDRVFPSYSEIIATGSPVHWHTNAMTFSRRESGQEANLLVPHDILHPWAQLSATGREVVTEGNLSLLMSLIWFAVVLMIWSCIGGMITRIVALRFAQDRRESFSRLLFFQRKKWLSYIGAMILPLIGAFVVLLPVWLLGWLWQTIGGSMNPGLLHSLGGFIHLVLMFPFALAAVLAMIGFIFGWPLMIAAVSAEGSDAFDAISRGFSYIYQRPIPFVFYHLSNLVIYTIGVVIVWFVFHQTVTLIGYDPAGLTILFNSFAFAYFWSSSTVIYFLLRRSCDATPFDQVYLGDVNKRTLPPFGFGKNGEPELKNNKAEQLSE
ncbi:MAG: hypothetical protein FWH27_19195 [Planctomycetaceae bacterium]|nr:hypothetical protein [Planctomycetaceae bacterium]